MKRNDGTTYESERCADNACREAHRRWLVVECDFKKFDKDGKPTIWKPSIEKWEAAGITVKDASVRVLAYLLSAHQQSIALVVDSGGKSLHAWINARAFEPGRMKEFQDHACKLGADFRAFLLSQWVRLPGGTRINGDTNSIGTTLSSSTFTSCRQEIVYFNQAACPQKENLSPVTS